MGFTNQDPGCCCGGCISGICATACGVSVSGITFAVTNTSGFSGSCTTDVTGCCGVTIPAAGTYTVTPSGGPSSGESYLVHLGCGTTTFIDLGASDPTDPDPPPPTFQCCGNNGCILPNVMTLTDGGGSCAFTFDGTSTWTGSITMETPSLAPQPPPDGCDCPVPESGSLTINYTGICTTADVGPAMFQVTKRWSVASCFPDDLGNQCGAAPFYYLLDGFGCLVPSPVCPFNNTAVLNQAPSTCNPFLWSGSLVPAVANVTPDPNGASVTVTA